MSILADQPALRKDLSDAGKRALVTALEDGELILRGCYWSGKKSGRYQLLTVMNLYDRFLFTIIIDGKHRPALKKAKLTQVGEFAAMEIQRQMQKGLFARERELPRDEAAMAFIGEVVG